MVLSRAKMVFAQMLKERIKDMTKQTKQTKTTKATKATGKTIDEQKRQAAEILSETKEKVLSAFKEAVNGEKTLTSVAVEAVANYFIANKRIVSDEYIKDFSKEWKKAGFTTKYQSGVFYRVLMTLKKNEGLVVKCAYMESVKKGEKTLADAIKDKCYAEKLGLTSCKTLAEINRKKQEDAEKRADRKATAPTAESTEQATAPTKKATEQATDKLQKILDFIATCNLSSLTAIKSAVEKREQVDRKLQATA